MARVGKLTKLKSAIKRLPSFTRFARAPSGSNLCSNDANKARNDVVSRAVYVGKSRRRYLVSSDVIDHPLFQELVDKSKTNQNGDDDDENDAVFVACEVVMFEHLLWMLHNAEAGQLAGPADELVDFYTC